MPKLLVFAYYFPPSGGPGVQRTLRMVRHLPRFGWEPTVVTVDEAHAAYPSIDLSLAAEVPPGLQVVRTHAFDPYAGYARLTGRSKDSAVSVGFADAGPPGWRERLARWIRANVFIPDARLGWVRPARKAGLKLARTRSFDAVWSTGPPHSTHLAARDVAGACRLPWIADFRDSWPDPTYAHLLPTGALARAIDARLRRSVLSRVDGATAVGEAMATGLRAQTTGPVTVIENGFEASDFEGVAPEPHTGFELLYTGNMPAERNPQALWTAIARHRSTMPEFRVRLVGTIDDAVLRSVRDAGLDDMVTTEPVIPHDKAVRAMISADALLLSINRAEGSEGILTGKVYEYVASGRRASTNRRRGC